MKIQEMVILELKFHTLCLLLTYAMQSRSQNILFIDHILATQWATHHVSKRPSTVISNKHFDRQAWLIWKLFTSTCRLGLGYKQKGSELYHLSTKYSCSTKCKIYFAIVKGMHQRSVNLRMKFWCLQIFQKGNQILDRFLPYEAVENLVGLGDFFKFSHNI